MKEESLDSKEETSLKGAGMKGRLRPGLQAVERDAPNRQQALAKLCARVAYENRAEDIRILRIGSLCSYTDFFVLATGMNRNQLRAIAEETDEAMEASALARRGREGMETGGWVLLDYGDVIVHLFEPDARNFYQLEELWADAPVVRWARPRHAPRPRERAKRGAKAS
ncbi:MAG: ribosome silencing factor [Planctomycetota bacterium]